MIDALHRLHTSHYLRALLNKTQGCDTTTVACEFGLTAPSAWCCIVTCPYAHCLVQRCRSKAPADGGPGKLRHLRDTVNLASVYYIVMKSCFQKGKPLWAH